MSLPVFHQPFLVYIPCYNCARTIAAVIDAIPEEFADKAEILIIDNQSTDGTGEVIRGMPECRFRCTVVRTSRNLGYAGSQKLAYHLALQSPIVRHVIMLHGDGQYPPELLRAFLPLAQQGCDIGYGYRSKLRYGAVEETPLLTFAVIRILSILESIVTLTFRKEWHTGFIMYSTRFLGNVPLQVLTTTPHIDGHLLYAGGQLDAKVQGIPIFKRYRDLQAFEGEARSRYVIDVLKLMFAFRKIRLTGVEKLPPYSDEDYSVNTVVEPERALAT